VNPNVAMLTGFMCHHDSEIAIQRGMEGAQFFAYGLGHYWRHGTHIPGRTNMWSDFKKQPASAVEKMERERKKAGMNGIGSPEQLIENFRAFEEAGVDQLIFLQQSGNYRHEHICKSMELFAKEVLPQFKEREAIREKLKQEELATFVADALGNMEKLQPMNEIPAVAAYPLTWNSMSGGNDQVVPDRRPGLSAFWQIQVGGNRSKK
jgi:hypothetical protein